MTNLAAFDASADYLRTQRQRLAGNIRKPSLEISRGLSAAFQMEGSLSRCPFAVNLFQWPIGKKAASLSTRISPSRFMPGLPAFSAKAILAASLLTKTFDHEGSFTRMGSPKNTAKGSFWTPTNIGLIGAAVILVATILYTFYREDNSSQTVSNSTSGASATQPSSSNSAPAATMTGKPAASLVLPENLMQANISLLDGKKKRLADYSGKVLIVDLWATWCGPCRQEIPHLVQIANDYKSKGVEVIGLTNENPQTDAQFVKAFSKEFKINYPIGWADMPMQIGLMQGRNGIPQTLIIGRDGKIRHHFVGFSAPISVPQMKAAVEAAVAAG